MASDTTVFIVDDDPEFRHSTQWLLKEAGFTVETFSSAERFLQDADPQAPACVLADMRMSGMSGLELQTVMAKQQLCIPVIIITGHADVPMAVRAIESGASAFLEKPFRRQELLDRIQDALARDEESRGRRTRRAEAEALLATLTPREREVMNHVVSGRTTKAIAHELGISPKTIELHRASVMKKLRVDSVAALVTLTVQYGFRDPDHGHHTGE